MKIREEFIDGEGDTFHVKTTYANQPYLDRTKLLRDAELPTPMAESWHVGAVPMHVYSQWAKEAGVPWGSEAHKEVARKKLLSGEFNNLRPHLGKY